MLSSGEEVLRSQVEIEEVAGELLERGVRLVFESDGPIAHVAADSVPRHGCGTYERGVRRPREKQAFHMWQT
jgi:hypothetical protein